MTVFNREKMVGEAVTSVLRQSLADFELIVVDDASTDGTWDILEEFAERDPRVRLLRNETRSRGGPVEWEPRNDGLGLASGEYVAYLDGDNAWHPDFLEKSSRILSNDPDVQLVHCDSRNHYPPGVIQSVLENDLRELAASGPDWTVFSYSKLDPSLLGRGIYIDTNEIMHRRSVFGEIGGFWRTFHPERAEINALQVPKRTYRRHNDLDLVERVVRAFGVESVYHLAEPLVDFFYFAD